MDHRVCISENLQRYAGLATEHADDITEAITQPASDYDAAANSERVLLPFSQMDPLEGIDREGPVNDHIDLCSVSQIGFPDGYGVPATPSMLGVSQSSESVDQSVQVGVSPGQVQQVPIERRRLRLRTKTRVSCESATACDPGVCDADTVRLHTDDGLLGPELRVLWPTEAKWATMRSRHRYDYVYDHVRNYWTKHLAGLQQVVGSPAPVRHIAQTAGRHVNRHLWKTLGPLERRAAATSWARACSPPARIAWELDCVFPAGPSRSGIKASSTMLLTFIGPWSLRTAKGEMADWSSAGDVDRVVETLRQWVSVKELWDRMVQHGRRLAQMLGVTDVAICLEICTATFEDNGHVQMHMHVFFRANTAVRMPGLACLAMDGAVPHAAGVIGGMPLARKSNSWSGYYYCVADKIGQLFSYGTRRPYKDFLVDPKWAFNLLQAGKITIETAREAAVAGCTNTKRLLEELKTLEAEAEKKEIERAYKRAKAALGGSLSTWKVYEEVNEWQQQYDQTHWRYRFLVLVGPSRLGKTCFARSLVRPGNAEVLEVNCSAGEEPDLRGFRFKTHKLILFDEIEPAAVSKQRKLFQATLARVQLGCSATNCFSYEVFVHGIRMVLATNHWDKALAKLPVDDQDWLQKNAIVLRLDAPCWQSTSCEPAAPEHGDSVGWLDARSDTCSAASFQPSFSS